MRNPFNGGSEIRPTPKKSDKLQLRYPKRSSHPNIPKQKLEKNKKKEK